MVFEELEDSYIIKWVFHEALEDEVFENYLEETAQTVSASADNEVDVFVRYVFSTNHN